MDQNWIFRTTPRIVFGCGSVGQAGTEAKAAGISRALLVTDPGVKAAGISGMVEKALLSAGIEVVVYDAVESDPRIEIVEKCASAARGGKCDGVVAVGGGSALDIGKLAAVMGKNEGPIGKYFGIDLIPSPGLPTVLLPTTSGTGSEVTPIAVLSDEGEHLKKGVVSPYLFPKVAILDPALTLGCPPGVTAASGMDALIHGIESYTSIHASRFTEFLAYKAVETIAGSLRTAYANGADLSARTRMMEGSLWAGMAFANSGVAAVHAFAYPLGGEYHVPHGVANTVMLPYVMRFNMVGALKRYADLAPALGVAECRCGMTDTDRAEAAIAAVERLADDIRVPRRLRDLNIPESGIPVMAEGVMKVTRLLANNPRTITVQDAEAIYRSAY